MTHCPALLKSQATRNIKKKQKQKKTKQKTNNKEKI
jgi:hypothetical protein